MNNIAAGTLIAAQRRRVSENLAVMRLRRRNCHRVHFTLVSFINFLFNSLLR
jgi:hypothetical protein